MVDWATVLGFLLAIIAMWMSLQQSKESSVMADSLKRVAASLPTRYVADFPHNLAEVNRLIRGTKSELIIVVDVLGYAQFSNNAEFRIYKSAIEELARRQLNASGETVRVRIQAHDPDIVNRKRREQFAKEFEIADPDAGNGESLAKLFSSDKWKRYTAVYRHFAKEENRPKSWEDFFQLLEGKTEQIRNDFEDAGVEIVDVHHEHPILAWISDRKEAVYAIVPLGTRSEATFYTRDHHVIEGLLSLVEEPPK